ncbi:hypothetical protein DCAR_0102563 [Daucus carota subsp. sativus]|uniref:Uncharacterized protein n=1 Tax=Daucus carota subsp. sativus TaxID=79200 RepID=A0AAF0W816_DAUCS|nr:PREDICTED: uncharacterized protein LOC108226692 isoform X1 [Daucus carota subsp. sativus]WOG83388.1 hypothetical protein DCAR_0102563 [Daucus carota subsp. sativus]
MPAYVLLIIRFSRHISRYHRGGYRGDFFSVFGFCCLHGQWMVVVSIPLGALSPFPADSHVVVREIRTPPQPIIEAWNWIFDLVAGGLIDFQV